MLYIVETTARASIREFWRVEAENEDEAREAIEDGGGIASEFLFDEVIGDEEDREATHIHPADYIAGTLAINRAQQAAPAILAALQQAESFIAGFDDDDTQEGVPAMLQAMRAAIAAATGAPTSGEAGPIVGEVDGLGREYACNACGRPESECSAEPCDDVIADRES